MSQLNKWYGKTGNKCHKMFDLLKNQIITQCGQRIYIKDSIQYNNPSENGKCITCKRNKWPGISLN